MLKWRMIAALGVAVGITGASWGYAQQRAAPGFYELRIYKAQPGQRDALAQRFASRTATTYARHGITNVGYWIPLESVIDFKREVYRRALMELERYLHARPHTRRERLYGWAHPEMPASYTDPVTSR